MPEIPKNLLARVFETLAEKYNQADALEGQPMTPELARALADLMPDTVGGQWLAYELRMLALEAEGKQS